MKKIIIAMLLIFSTWCSYSFASEYSPKLEQLHFDIHINKDGSIDVEEKWQLKKDVSNVAIMNLHVEGYQTEKISNIKVAGLASERAYEFEKGDYDISNMTNGYYTVVNSGDNLYVIAGKGKYNNVSLSYKISNAISIYSDCAELYLKLLKDSTNLKVSNVTGNIYLPQAVNKAEDIYAWKHISGRYYDVETDDLKKITFEENYPDSLNLEIRLLFPNSMIENSFGVISQNTKSSIIHEERNQVVATSAKDMVLKVVFSIIEGIILILFIIRVFELIREYGKLYAKEEIPCMKYCKVLPYENITPGQAAFIKDLNLMKIGDVFAATLLNLKIKGIIDIVCEGKEGDLANTFIKIINITPTLTKEENPVFQFLVECVTDYEKTKLSVSLEELEKYIAMHTQKVSELKKALVEEIKASVTSYDKVADKKVQKKYREMISYAVIFILMLCIHKLQFDLFSLHTWVSMLSVVNFVFAVRIAMKINLLTPEGMAHREKLKALERYMLEFSDFKEKGVPEISVWEYYLIFATAFGISKKVLAQINTCYPDVSGSEFVDEYLACKNLAKCNFKRSFMFAISSE